MVPEKSPGSLTIPDLGSAFIPRAVLLTYRTAYGPSTWTTLPPLRPWEYEAKLIWENLLLPAFGMQHLGSEGVNGALGGPKQLSNIYQKLLS